MVDMHFTKVTKKSSRFCGFGMTGGEIFEAQAVQGAVATPCCTRCVAMPLVMVAGLVRQIVATAQALQPSDATMPDVWGPWSMNSFLNDVQHMRGGGFLDN